MSDMCSGNWFQVIVQREFKGGRFSDSKVSRDELGDEETPTTLPAELESNVSGEPESPTNRLSSGAKAKSEQETASSAAMVGADLEETTKQQLKWVTKHKEQEPQNKKSALEEISLATRVRLPLVQR